MPPRPPSRPGRCAPPPRPAPAGPRGGATEERDQDAHVHGSISLWVVLPPPSYRSRGPRDKPGPAPPVRRWIRTAASPTLEGDPSRPAMIARHTNRPLTVTALLCALF